MEEVPSKVFWCGSEDYTISNFSEINPFEEFTECESCVERS